MTTIADIAKAAGVSEATVSRVLNERAEGVGAETRKRVKGIIEQMQFEPCGVARGLATGKSRSIGLVIPDVADPFFPLLIRGIEDALRCHGYGLFLCDSDRDFRKEQENVRMLLEKRVDGVIINSTLSDCDAQLDLLEKRAVPYVLLDRIIELRPLGAGVYVDNWMGARMAAAVHQRAGAALGLQAAPERGRGRLPGPWRRTGDDPRGERRLFGGERRAGHRRLPGRPGREAALRRDLRRQ